MRELLIDTVAYIPPARALEDLEPKDAEQRLAGANHSIAEIVAHLTFWATWFSKRCAGIGEPMPTSAAQGWPQVAAESWPEVRRQFLDVLERLAADGENQDLGASVTPPIEFPPLAQYTVRDALVHVSNHNAHHLGQIVVLRQVMGRWPPPSGSWTW